MAKAEKKKTGRKPLPENEKKKQKSVYISDDEEKKILDNTQKETLTDAILTLAKPNRKTR